MNDILPPVTEKEIVDEPPPFLGTWKRVYVAVLTYVAFVIFSFYLFSRAFGA
jgi:hypothetical protein